MLCVTKAMFCFFLPLILFVVLSGVATMTQVVKGEQVWVLWVAPAVIGSNQYCYCPSVFVLMIHFCSFNSGRGSPLEVGPRFRPVVTLLAAHICN